MLARGGMRRRDDAGVLGLIDTVGVLGEFVALPDTAIGSGTMDRFATGVARLSAADGVPGARRPRPRTSEGTIAGNSAFGSVLCEYTYVQQAHRRSDRKV